MLLRPGLPVTWGAANQRGPHTTWRYCKSTYGFAAIDSGYIPAKLGHILSYDTTVGYAGFLTWYFTLSGLGPPSGSTVWQIASSFRNSRTTSRSSCDSHAPPISLLHQADWFMYQKKFV